MPPLAPRGQLVAVAAAVTVVALARWGPVPRVYTGAAHAPGEGRHAARPDALVKSVHEWGPLRVGSTFAGWRLAELRTEARGATLDLVRADRHLSLRVEARGSSGRAGPFDVRSASVTHGATDLPFAEFAGAGAAVARAIDDASPDGSAHLDAWWSAAR